MEMIKTSNLKKVYNESEIHNVALKDVSISVEDREFVAIMGASGSGKTTLLNMLGGLDAPTEGKVFVEEVDMFALKDDELTKFRRRNIGYIFQQYNLIPTLNVYNNIILTVSVSGRDIDKNWLIEIVNTLGISDKLKSFPSELSGGQQQRVAIARALFTSPAVLLADEPTGNLDSKSSEEVMELLMRINEKYGMTILLITHDEKVASYADRIIKIKDGSLV